jgi:hypothetical protein
MFAIPFVVGDGVPTLEKVGARIYFIRHRRHRRRRHRHRRPYQFGRFRIATPDRPLAFGPHLESSVAGIPIRRFDSLLD